MNARVLVTGAGGFVCRHIVDALLTAGCTVIALDRDFDDTLRQRWAGSTLTFVYADASALPDLRVDHVVHGAALTAMPDEVDLSPLDHLRANLEPLLTVLGWAQRQATGRVICISSAAVLRHAHSPLLDETATAQVTGLYDTAKQTMEALARTLREEYAQDIVTVRLGNIYGPEEYARATRPRVSRIAEMLHAAQRTRRVVVPQASDPRDWTFAPDVGRAVVALLQQAALAFDLYHLASGEGVTEMQIAQAVQVVFPDLEIETTPPVPRSVRGVLTSVRLLQDTGFDTWTPLALGIRQCVELAAEASGQIMMGERPAAV